METLLVDPSWLVHSFTYRKYAGASNKGGFLFDDPVEVTKCRIDYRPSYTRSADRVTRIGDATIYCYGAFTQGAAMSDLVEKSRVTIDGKEYTVQATNRYAGITTKEPFCIELVVM